MLYDPLAECALDAIPVQAPHDALLDFAIALRDSIRGRTEHAHSAEDVNRALIETFDCMAIWTGGDDMLPPEQGVHAGRIKIDPIVRPEVVRLLLDEHADLAMVPPPMEWIEATRNSANDQETWHFRPLPVLRERSAPQSSALPREPAIHPDTARAVSRPPLAGATTRVGR